MTKVLPFGLSPAATIDSKDMTFLIEKRNANFSYMIQES